MITATPRKWARLIFNPYGAFLLKRHFSHFYRTNEYPCLPEGQPLVITPNHISWWDGFFIDFTCRAFLHRRGYLMMLEAQLRRYWFFQKVGAYSINPRSPQSIIETARYTRSLLSNPENFVVLYPQGDIEPFEKRPLTLKRGMVLFTRSLPSAQILPLAFKIHFYHEKKPAVLVRFAEPLSAACLAHDFTRYEHAFYANLDLLTKAAEEKSFLEDMLRS